MCKRILVVDDEYEIRTMLSKMLLRSSYKVYEAENGNEALACLEQNHIDLALIDMLMPEKEGVETIIAMRHSHPNIKIIAMSGGGRGGARHYLDMARLFGADHAFEKPLVKADLLAAIESLLSDAGAVGKSVEP